jgi:hypothetical protein
MPSARVTMAEIEGRTLLLLRSQRGPMEIQEGSKHFDPKKQASDNAKNNNCRTFPSSCRLSSLGLVAIGGRMTPVYCPTGGGSVQ